MTVQRVVVIGAGLGGLAAAVRMACKGHRVTLVDRLPTLGGRARTFRRDGFVFDAGPTVIKAPFLLDELFALAGRRREDYVEMLPVDPFYRVRFSDGLTFDCCGDLDRTLAQVRAISPRDEKGFLDLLAMSERIFEKGFTELSDVPFDSVMDMVRIVPAMARLRSDLTVWQMVSRYVRDDHLRQAFSFHPLLVGGNPFRTTSIYLLIHYLERKWGVWFPKGGTGAMIAALGRLLEELGVDVRLSAEVEEIEVTQGAARGVRLAGGARLPADVVVSNGDPAWVYKRLVAPEHRRHDTDRAIDRKRFSMGLFVVYFGSKQRYPDLAHHTILLGPRYRELISDIFDRKVLARDFSLYLHAPTRTDPALAPPGHDCFYALSPVPNLDAGIDWDEAGPRYRDAILQSLDETVTPGLTGNLTAVDHVTPRYFREDLLSSRGAGFSIEPVLTQSAWFRFHNRSEDVRGLYLVGAGTHPGAGVPGVLCSARVLDRLVPAAGSAA